MEKTCLKCRIEIKKERGRQTPNYCSAECAYEPGEKKVMEFYEVQDHCGPSVFKSMSDEWRDPGTFYRGKWQGE